MTKPPKNFPDDMHLFREVVAEGKRLQQPERVTAPPQTAPKREIPAPKPQAPKRDLISGAGVDAATFQKFKRGEIMIEATLDLHGATLEDAYQRLSRFITQSAARNMRCVLVITGKGSAKSYETGIAEAEGGVLRREVPRWLQESHQGQNILAISAAQPKHGGAGALYLLLKRKRES